MSNARKMTLIVFALVAVLSAFFLPFRDWALVAYEWSLENPIGGAFAFLALFVVWVIFALPASLLMLTGGFLFGLQNGFGLVFLGSLLGSTLAFLIARNLARNAVAKRIGEDVRLVAIDKAIKDSALPVVLLTRLSLVLPYNLLNYAYGLTSVKFSDYVLGTTVGMFLPLLLFTFLGTTAKDLTSVLQGEVQLQGQTWIFALLGIIAVSTTVGLITVKAKRALAEILEE